MNPKSIAIARLEIRLPKQTLKLDADEARLLHQELQRLFVREQCAHEHPAQPVIIHQPIVIHRDADWWPHPWQIWCGADAPQTLSIDCGRTV